MTDDKLRQIETEAASLPQPWRGYLPALVAETRQLRARLEGHPHDFESVICWCGMDHRWKKGRATTFADKLRDGTPRPGHAEIAYGALDKRPGELSLDDLDAVASLTPTNGAYDLDDVVDRLVEEIRWFKKRERAKGE
jgi:hypothetical protein